MLIVQFSKIAQRPIFEPLYSIQEMDKNQIIESLIYGFINKNKRERCQFELNNSKKRVNFINRLNHEISGIFIAEKIQKIAKNFEFANDLITAIPIKKESNCYVLSNNEKIDDKFLTFEQAINEAFGFGLGSVIYDYENGNLYLEGEQEFGAPDRFIGRM